MPSSQSQQSRGWISACNRAGISIAFWRLAKSYSLALYMTPSHCFLMKILFMANVSPSPNSGAAGTEFQTAKALRELGHTVDDVWTDELSHHLGHFNLYNLLELPLSYRKALRRQLQSRKYDVVHVNQPHGYLAAKALRTLDTQAIFVHRSHGLEGRV